MTVDKPLVVLTGAGISAESGVPTFRGQDGIWQDYRAEDLATPIAFERDPELVWRFYAWRRELVSGCQPNQAHHLLVDLEIKSSQFTLITQNVDGLHKIAGSQNVLELHGSLWELQCTNCKSKWPNHDVPFAEFPPLCPFCSSLARPAVIWFGESLNPDTLDRAFKVSSNAATMLVIGTSALVHPAAQLPIIAQLNGASVIEINPEETPLSSRMDEIFRTSATEGVKRWYDQQYWVD